MRYKKRILNIVFMSLIVLTFSACAKEEPIAENPSTQENTSVQENAAAQENTAEKSGVEEGTAPESGKTKDETTADQVEKGSNTETAELTGEFKSFSTYDLSGNVVTQDILTKADLTVLNIWGTYCGPCLREMPDLGTLAGEYQDKGVQFIGIPVDVTDEETAKKAAELVVSTKADYTHLLPNQDLYDIVLKDVYAVPQTYFIDSTGTIIGSVTGSKSKEKWQKLIDEQLSQLKTTQEF